MSYLDENPNMSVDELEEKLYNDVINTPIGKSNNKEATRNACRAAAKSARREHTRTKNTIKKNGMNPETTEVSHVWGSKTSLENTVKHLAKLGVTKVNGIDFDPDYKKIILAGGAGKNPTDTMIVMVDDSQKPPKAIINHTSNKTSSNDIQGNSSPDKNADFIMNKADEDLKNGKISEEEHKEITLEATRLREDLINAQNQIEESIEQQFGRMKDDITDPERRKDLINKIKNLSTSKKGPAGKWELLAKRYGKDIKGREFNHKTGEYTPPLSEEEEAEIIKSYYDEMNTLATSDEEVSEPPKAVQQIMAREGMYPPPEEELNELYTYQHTLITEMRQKIDKIKPGYGTQMAARNVLERLHLDVIEGHNPGGIPRENFEVNCGNNDSGLKFDEDGNSWHHVGAGYYQKINPETGEPEGEKVRPPKAPKEGHDMFAIGDNSVVINSETITKALGLEPPVENITSKIRVGEVKSGKGKSGVATLYGINSKGKEIIIGYQTIRPKQGPGSKHQDTIQFHPDFQKGLMKATLEMEE